MIIYDLQCLVVPELIQEVIGIDVMYDLMVQINFKSKEIKMSNNNKDELLVWRKFNWKYSMWSNKAMKLVGWIGNRRFWGGGAELYGI